MASAQSSVTLFGTVDAGISYYDAKSNTGVKQSSWQQTNSGYNSSRIGFRGTEDLGGGLAAGFWLEGALANDNGNVSGLNFQRRSTVSLSGLFGEVRLGRDYTATFWNDTVFDPFGTNGVGTNVIMAAHSTGLTGVAYQGATTAADGTQVRSNNMVGYFLPANLNGFYGQVQYAFPENVKTDGTTQNKTNQYYGGRFGYANGPLDIAAAFGQNTTANTGAVDSINGDTRLKTFNLGASYDMGVVKLFGEISQVNNDFSGVSGEPSIKLEGYLFGVTAPIGAGLIRASYSTAKLKLDGAPDPTTSKLAVGYVYNLSKRTALYATYAHVSNKDGAFVTTNMSGGLPLAGTPGATGMSSIKSSNGYDFGIRHSF